MCDAFYNKNKNKTQDRNSALISNGSTDCALKLIKYIYVCTHIWMRVMKNKYH